MEGREFLHGMFASGLTAASAFGQQRQQRLMLRSCPGPVLLEKSGETCSIENWGRTGETVSAIGLGGSHLAKASITEAESKRLIHAAIDRGITFMDNSWDYNEGRSERWMGEALAENGSRNKVFLMTKIDGRTKDLAINQINTSLQRLRTDHLDLVPFCASTTV